MKPQLSVPLSAVFLSLLLLTAASAAQGSAPPGEGSATTASAPADPMQRPFWSGLAGEIALDKEQQQSLATKVQAKRDALAEFDRVNNPAIAEAMAFYDLHKKARNKREQVKAMLEKVDQLREARRKLQCKHQEQILAVLTTRQKAQYEHYRLCTVLERYYAAAQPSQAQKAQLRKLAQPVSQKMPGVAPDNQPQREELTRRLIQETRAAIAWTPRQLYELDEGGKTSHVRLPTIEEEESP